MNTVTLTKKPLTVSAIQFTGDNADEVIQFTGGTSKFDAEKEAIVLDTKEGLMHAFKGHYVIKEPVPTGDRDFYPVREDIICNTYDFDGKSPVNEGAPIITFNQLVSFGKYMSGSEEKPTHADVSNWIFEAGVEVSTGWPAEYQH